MATEKIDHIGGVSHRKMLVIQLVQATSGYDILVGPIHKTHPLALVDGGLDSSRAGTVFD